MKTGILGISAIAVLGVTAFAWQKAPEVLPEPYHTPSAMNRPKVVPRPDGAALHVPQGFNIEEYATGFERPRYMILGPSKEILLSDSVKNGKVHVLVDQGGDHEVDSRKVLIEGLDRPYGLAFWKDYLYVAESTSLKRYKYDAKAMTVGAGEEIVEMADFGKGHWTRTVLFDRKAEKMYLTIGSASNVSPGEPPRRAAINRYNPDGSGHEIFAAGVRNTIGLDWQPGTDLLWAAVQERDGLGDDLVPDYFTRIAEGGFYGWPFAYIGPNEDPRRKDEATDLVKKTIKPDFPLQAHVAVLDARFYTGEQFPKEYQGGAFVACHGSWNRAKRVGYNVIFFPFRDGKATGEVKEFMTGFMSDPDSRDVWGRPVGLLQLPDGSLLVSDDGGNKVWRISYTG
jgi:glucose/arabinose dehydrogenase